MVFAYPSSPCGFSYHIPSQLADALDRVQELEGRLAAKGASQRDLEEEATILGDEVRRLREQLRDLQAELDEKDRIIDKMGTAARMNEASAEAEAARASELDDLLREKEHSIERLSTKLSRAMAELAARESHGERVLFL